MAFLAQVEGAKLMERIGGDTNLYNELWITGMMDELRRRPDWIPPLDNRTPVSLIIPFADGPKKVEYGYRAGAAFIRQRDDTTLELKNTDLFPACITLVLISLWYEAYDDYRRNFTCTLFIPETEDSGMFCSLVGRVAAKLPFLTLKIKSYSMPRVEPPARKASGSTFAVTGLQQTDVGRFVVSGVVRSGYFCPRDTVTLTDGSGTVLRENCPIISIIQGTGVNERELSRADASSGPLFLYLAFWFPANTPAFDGLNVVKEFPSPITDLPKMPPEVCIIPTVPKKRSIFSLFS